MTPYAKVREHYSFPFELRPYQIDEVNALAPFERAGYYWEPGCVDASTEYLTPIGWRNISEYTGGTVAQYLPDTGAIEFVTPTEYIDQPCESMVRVKTKYGIDQLLSGDHRVLLYRADRQSPGTVMLAKDLLSAHDDHLSGVRASVGHSRLKTEKLAIAKVSIPSVFSPPGGDGIPLSDALLRLQVAVIADGHFQSPSNRCVVRVKRERKVVRLRELLHASNVAFREQQGDTISAQGFHVFTFNAPLRLKEFDAYFWAASKPQIALLAEEVVHWDGSDLAGNRGTSFTSTSKDSADFVQYLWIATGRTTRVTPDPRQGKYTMGACYTVTARGGSSGGHRGLLHIRNKVAKTMWIEPAPGGRKYCFSVPSTFLVLRRNGCVFATGNSGKTAASTHHALHWIIRKKADRWLLVMPPVLLLQWQTWLEKVRNLKTGLTPSITVYQGEPKKRKALNLDAQFILVSYGILKNDFEYLYEKLNSGSFGVICDEAHAIKNIESQTHKAVALISEGRPLVPLTGTPITHPGDAYAFIKLIVPGVYRNKRQFERIHIDQVDEWGSVVAWQNLDLLAKHMKIQTSRILRRDVRKDLPPVVYTPVSYNLDPAHMKLYRQISEERLVEFENGREIDAISASALRSALQQVICNWAEFDDNPNRRPAALDMVESYLDELGEGKKLAVVANFRRTNAYMLEALKKYGAVAVYGDVSPAGKQKAIQDFISDPKCRVILLQPQSAGYGVDGLQHVCSDMLFIEAPTTAPPFNQTVARLDRDGQTDVVNCRVAVAAGTVQVRMFHNLLNNDEQANKVQGGFKDLKESVYGS